MYHNICITVAILAQALSHRCFALVWLGLGVNPPPFWPKNRVVLFGPGRTVCLRSHALFVARVWAATKGTGVIVLQWRTTDDSSAPTPLTGGELRKQRRHWQGITSTGYASSAGRSILPPSSMASPRQGRYATCTMATAAVVQQG